MERNRRELGDAARQLLGSQGRRLAQHFLDFAAAGRLVLAWRPDVAESPRWLFRRGRKQAALAALLRTRNAEAGRPELARNGRNRRRRRQKSQTAKGNGERIAPHRKYVIPFLLACIILACNQLTGINSIICYNANILIQAD